jgi:hypothetical protein
MSSSAAIAGAVRSGEVAAFCRDNNISRQTFYKYRRRFELEGAGGLETRSRRPRTTPTAVGADLEDAIVRARKELDDLGTDNGVWSIRQRLLDDEDVAAVPSQATIWRVLKRRGMIVAEPKKRPKGSFRRFVFPRPNDCWQIDATHYSLADHSVVESTSSMITRGCVRPVGRSSTAPPSTRGKPSPKAAPTGAYQHGCCPTTAPSSTSPAATDNRSSN